MGWGYSSVADTCLPSTCKALALKKGKKKGREEGREGKKEERKDEKGRQGNERRKDGRGEGERIFNTKHYIKFS